MKEVLIEKRGNIDVIDWVTLGKHYMKNGDEEIAFQCYYMAHLLDPDRIRANSDLAFETLDNPNV